ncbi:MAG: CPBP family intramembrane glutamic endopeptidase [Bacteroidota bacterium]|nr:CPBP family intramembrane glutamic endopeptidase [Bacteroidota bacterium]
MPEAKRTISDRIRDHPGRIRDVFLSFLGILLFAGFIHHPFPYKLIAIGGLAVTAAVIGFSTRDMTLLEAFGIGQLNRRILLYTIIAIGLGILLGTLTRNRFEMTLLPAGFTGVAFVAPLVGSVEELVFRGYIQGHLRPAGKGLSIVTGSTTHTCYKLLVILSLATPLQFDFFFLILWTFVGGLLFGILRELSGSTFPPVIAHAVFDVVLYGTMLTAPVWVWS